MRVEIAGYPQTGTARPGPARFLRRLEVLQHFGEPSIDRQIADGSTAGGRQRGFHRARGAGASRRPAAAAHWSIPASRAATRNPTGTLDDVTQVGRTAAGASESASGELNPRELAGGEVLPALLQQTARSTGRFPYFSITSRAAPWTRSFGMRAPSPLGGRGACRVGLAAVQQFEDGDTVPLAAARAGPECYIREEGGFAGLSAPPRLEGEDGRRDGVARRRRYRSHRAARSSRVG